MQFQLPQSLIERVGVYDPKMRPAITAAAAAKKKAAAPARPRMALGLPTGLVPPEFMNAEAALALATSMNESTANDRFRDFDCKYGSAIILHHNGMWISMWFWNKDYAKDYIYGLKITHRNTDTAIDKVNSVLRNVGLSNKSMSGDFLGLATSTEVTYNRVGFIERELLITAEMIINGRDRLITDSIIRQWGRKDYEKNRACNVFKAALKKRYNSWQDDSGLFSRIIQQNDVRRCVWNLLPGQTDTSFVDLCLSNSGINGNAKLNIPFFRKEANKVFDQSIKMYLNVDNKKSSEVGKYYRAFEHRIECIKDFLEIYPNATTDHCQQIYGLAVDMIRVPGKYAFNGVKKWISQNMPIASYMQVLTNAIQEAKADCNAYSKSIRFGMTLYTVRQFDDVFDMLGQLHNVQQKKGVICGYEQSLQLQKPNRWRLQEFHDYVASECFKVSTPNEKLRQDLFPEPIRVDIHDKRWSFFQPHDVHQLASWGKAVRNCVGSAGSYRAGIKNQTHFIILVMIDSSPRYTAQVSLRDMQLIIDQIADVCNKRLNSMEIEQVSDAFRLALTLEAAK